ncbi:hypothetical protein H5410_003531 [Solanum commersonii]|uniref:Uncharacterized protein n=1 Tax=Solanum commersonii TaxID=4109 RepID=A0A9J6B4Z1_SOLCO|nr:hypothetical protein H5410_003531 [Solanum commersonii]
MTLWIRFIIEMFGLFNLWTTEEVYRTFGYSVWKIIRRLWLQFNSNISFKMENAMESTCWNLTCRRALNDWEVSPSPMTNLFGSYIASLSKSSVLKGEHLIAFGERRGKARPHHLLLERQSEIKKTLVAFFHPKHFSEGSSSEAGNFKRLPSSPNMFPRPVLKGAILRAPVVVTLLHSVNPILRFAPKDSVWDFPHHRAFSQCF